MRWRGTARTHSWQTTQTDIHCGRDREELRSTDTGWKKTTAELGTANGDGENVYEMNNYEGTGSEPSPHGMVEDGELMDTIPTTRARCGARLPKTVFANPMPTTRRRARCVRKSHSLRLSEPAGPVRKAEIVFAYLGRVRTS